MRYAWIKPFAVSALTLIVADGGFAGMARAEGDPATQNLKTGHDYLIKVAKTPGVVKLPSGVLYRIISRSPTPGAQPTVADVVTIQYEGKLIDGHVFDSSFTRGEPANFPLGALVPAWQQVIPLMHVGDEIVLYSPPSEAYGDRDVGDIPPNSTLIFRVQLLGIGTQ